MKRTHISGISIRQVIERHPVFQGLKWLGSTKFPDMCNISVIEKKNGDGGILVDNDNFGGQISWAYFEGKNPLMGKALGELDKDEIDFIKKSYPEFHSAIINLDA